MERMENLAAEPPEPAWGFIGRGLRGLADVVRLKPFSHAER
jgi:hypothetical protein